MSKRVIKMPVQFWPFEGNKIIHCTFPFLINLLTLSLEDMIKGKKTTSLTYISPVFYPHFVSQSDHNPDTLSFDVTSHRPPVLDLTSRCRGHQYSKPWSDDISGAGSVKMAPAPTAHINIVVTWPKIYIS